MLRRRLFAYTALYASGIACGYLLCEAARIVGSLCTLFSIGACIYLVQGERSVTTAERKKLFACLIAGFLMFVIAFVDINSADNFSPVSEGSYLTGDEYVLTGRIKEIREKDYGYELIVRPCSGDFRELIRLALIDDEHGLDEDGSGIYSHIGDSIAARCRLKRPEGRDNPGCFDYRIYLASRGIKYNATVRNIEIVEVRSIYMSLHRALMRARADLERAFDEEKELRALVKGIVFGDKSEIDEETRDEFNENGTGHILAVSGLHIGFLFSLLHFMLKRRRTLGVNILIIIVLLSYGEMTMWSPATIRAVIVLSISLLSTAFLRRADLLTSVSLAALLLLIHNPYQLFNTGFQLSFFAMLGISFFAKPLSFFVGDYLSIVIAIQLGIAPITAFTFNRFNPLSAIINIPITILAAVLVPACILGIGLIIIIGILPECAQQLISGLLELLLRVNHSLNFDGEWSFNCCSINIGLLIGVYLIMFIISSEWFRIMLIRKAHGRIWRVLSLVLIIVVAFSLSTYNSFRDDEIVFVSVGQGDAMHIRCNGHNILIDGGGSHDRNIGKEVLRPYLLSNGAKSIDAAFLTHLHMDHYKGIEELSLELSINEVLLSSQYEGGFSIATSNPRYISAGDKYIIGRDCYIVPIWPIGSTSNDRIRSDDENEHNMVYMVYYRGLKIMVTGDLLEADEREMVQYYEGKHVLECDILKVSHHGSKSSSSEELLDAASPEVAIISVGANNMYGHPHEQTIKRLEERCVKIYRTDIDGAVGIDIRMLGRGYEIDTMRHKWSKDGI